MNKANLYGFSSDIKETRGGLILRVGRKQAGNTNEIMDGYLVVRMKNV